MRLLSTVSTSTYNTFCECANNHLSDAFIFISHDIFGNLTIVFKSVKNVQANIDKRTIFRRYFTATYIIGKARMYNIKN